MTFLLRRLLAYGRWVVLTLATAAAGGVYTVLSTHDSIAPLGGEPHVVEWWEPYVWPAVTFLVVGKAGRMAVNRLGLRAGEQLARLRR